MSTATVQDYRRTDLRTDVFKGAFWLVSKTVDGHEVSGLKDKACVLFSFPETGQQIIIREIVVRILRGFTAGTTLELGSYTLATDGVGTGGLATVVTDDAYVQAIDVDPTIEGFYYPTVGNYAEARGSGVTISGENLIVGAATNVPAIVITPQVSTVVIGQVQISLLVCIVPGS